MESAFNKSLTSLLTRLKAFEDGMALPESPITEIFNLKQGLLNESNPVSIEKLSLIIITIEKLLESELKFSRCVMFYNTLIEEIIDEDGGHNINTEALPISEEFRLLIEENLKLELRYYLSHIEEIITAYRIEKANEKPKIQITGPQTYEKLQPHFKCKLSKISTAFLLFWLKQSEYIANIDDKPLSLIMAPCFGHGAESTRKAFGLIHSDMTRDDWSELEEFSQLLMAANPYNKQKN